MKRKVLILALTCSLLLTGFSAVDLVMATVLILAAIAAIFTITLTRTEMITVILKKEKTPKYVERQPIKNDEIGKICIIPALLSSRHPTLLCL